MQAYYYYYYCAAAGCLALPAVMKCAHAMDVDVTFISLTQALQVM